MVITSETGRSAAACQILRELGQGGRQMIDEVAGHETARARLERRPDRAGTHRRPPPPAPAMP